MDIWISSSLVRGLSKIEDSSITNEGYMVETPRDGLTIGSLVTCPSGVFESVLAFEELSFEFAKESKSATSEVRLRELMTSGITRVLSRFGTSRLVGLVEDRLEAEPTGEPYNTDRIFERTEAKGLRGIVDSATSGFTRTIADSCV